MNREPETRIIGGMFALPEMESVGHSRPPFFIGKELLLVNGQSGVSILVERLSPANVWMPSYLCGSLLEAVQREGVRVRFYEVDYELAIPSMKWLEEVRKGDLVVFIDFFGFPCDVSYMDRARAQGAWVLEDACQALLSSRVGRCADFTVFSPRKFLGVPDGGILRLNCEMNFEGVELQSPPADWWLRAVRASVLRREFDVRGGSRRWFELFQKSEAEAPLGHFAMSELARTLLTHCFDYSEVARSRRRNYGILSEELHRVGLFRDLLPEVVPLGFPMRVQNRDRLQQVLFGHRVYPAIHWPIEGIVPAEFRASHRLAADVITLPCDQRYDSTDMRRMAQLVSEALVS